jgi:pimeloyl-ACP methyl ester carboxylesterase/DNA-binding CsgD family transcriptional regulator
MTDSRSVRQRVRYLPATDGLRLAWAEAGGGPTLVKAANWLTHLEYEWDSPVWKHWVRFFSQHWRFVRYDERGCGMSEWNADSLTIEQWTDDLGSVIDVAQPTGKVTLIGISQGAAISVRYAVLHPERVDRLILYGGFAHGASLRKGLLSYDLIFRGLVELAEFAWASDNWTFRQLFTSRFVPGGTDEQLKWFNELCLKSTTGPIAARLAQARDGVDVSALLSEVQVPTLILHARNDELVPFEEGRMLAAGIPGAEFVELDSRNHVLLEAEPAWARFCDAVLSFCSPSDAEDRSLFAGLSAREREVLGLLTEGLSNLDIATRLDISEKTVRNHASAVFDKLGVWSRAQAIVFARDHGFQR